MKAHAHVRDQRVSHIQVHVYNEQHSSNNSILESTPLRVLEEEKKETKIKIRDANLVVRKSSSRKERWTRWRGNSKPRIGAEWLADSSGHVRLRDNASRCDQHFCGESHLQRLLGSREGARDTRWIKQGLQLDRAIVS